MASLQTSKGCDGRLLALPSCRGRLQGTRLDVRIKRCPYPRRCLLREREPWFVSDWDGVFTRACVYQNIVAASLAA